MNLSDAVCCLNCETIYSNQEIECPTCLGRTNFKVKKFVSSLVSSPKEVKYGLSKEERSRLCLQNKDVSPIENNVGYIVLDRFIANPAGKFVDEVRRSHLETNGKTVQQASKPYKSYHFGGKFVESLCGVFKGRRGSHAGYAGSLVTNFKERGDN